MNMIDPSRPLEHGLVDAHGCLAEAEPRLQELNMRAGGSIGAPLAVPQLALIVRLARRLGIVVSRSIIVAMGAQDVTLWVRAEPLPGGGAVRLTISGWQHRSAWQPDDDILSPDRSFLDSEADWIWETDAALRLTHVTVDAGLRYGFDALAVLGQPLTALFALSEGATGSLPILGALATRVSFDNQPATIRNSGRPVLLSAIVRTNRHGGFAGITGGARMAERAMPPVAMPATAPGAPPFAAAPSITALTEAFSKQLDKVLRVPLGRIIANADSIHAQSDGPLRQDYVGYALDIATAGRHLLGLVDDLVDLQAVERADFAVVLEPLDLADVARRAAGLLAVRAANAGVRIDKPATDEALPAMGDFRRALQVLVNLVGNAVRYSPPDAMVWVRANREGGAVSITVADQGKGIAMSDQARIFEKFERVDPGEPGGSGLGLYIARRLARAMGGEVTVESDTGQGARFIFTLPARED